MPVSSPCLFYSLPVPFCTAVALHHTKMELPYPQLDTPQSPLVRDSVTAPPNQFKFNNGAGPPINHEYLCIPEDITSGAPNFQKWQFGLYIPQMEFIPSTSNPHAFPFPFPLYFCIYHRLESHSMIFQRKK